jgi:hypothetical protein
MIPQILWMREHFYLKRNPFPQGAILAVGSAEPSESGLIYEPRVSSKEVQEYIQKFVLSPSLSKGSGFGAIWSLGTGAPTSEARGYGKSSLGLYIAKEICKDFGKSILAANAINEMADQPFLLASYATFKKQVDTGFNAIAFRHVEWLAQPQTAFYNESPLQRLRMLIAKSLPQSYAAGSVEESQAIIDAVRAFRNEDSRFTGSTLGPMDGELLQALADPNPISVVSYLKGISQYRMWRNGFVYLDTVMTFAMKAGVTKIILFIDQIEDFASPDTPRSKKLKEIERFRDIVKETCPFNSLAFFILTMHPRGWGQIDDLWKDARLADILPPELQGVRENAVRVKILHEITKVDDATKLFESYLQNKEYRLLGAPSSIYPWNQEAIEYVMKANGGRAGYMLSHARDILDMAAQENVDSIDLEFVEQTKAKLPAEEIIKTAEETKGFPENLR